jgi:hypothetical protein
MLAAVPWTYWLALPLLVATVLDLIAITVVYYRKVIVPQHLWRQRQDAQRRAAARRPVQSDEVQPAVDRDDFAGDVRRVA